MSTILNISPTSDKAQTEFGEIVRDFNPVHHDDLAAKRSTFGKKIVHGISALLRQLETAFSDGQLSWIKPELPLDMRVDFKQPIYPDDRLSITITEKGSTRAQITAFVDQLKVASVYIEQGSKQPLGDLQGWQPIPRSARYELVKMRTPIDRSIEDIKCMKDFEVVAAENGALDLSKKFPMAAEALGPNRLYALGVLSSIVGMAVPGLYSLFIGFTAQFKAEPAKLITGPLTFKCRNKSVHTELGMVRTTANCAFLEANLETIARPRPVEQPACEQLLDTISEDELALPDLRGQSALVIGGSRGLGATATRILSLCGASVTFTYSSDKLGAEELVQELASRKVVSFQDNVLDPNLRHGDLKGQKFDQIYFFATPHIFVRKTKLFDKGLFKKFCSFYVDAFYDVFDTLLEPRGSIFYPSSVAVLTDDANTLEYRLAKLAGEELCKTLALRHADKQIVIRRLPRLASDQTATIQGGENADTISTLIEVICQMTNEHTCAQ